MKFPSSVDKSASLLSAFVGSVVNLGLGCYLFSLCRSLSWEQESEWEGSGFTLDRDGARLLCGLFSMYFVAASAICIFGVVGIIKSTPRFVRIYRDYVIGDFAFFTVFAVLASSAAVDPSTRAQLCEYISRQPDLLRDVVDLGLTLENCEQWFERGLVAFMAIFLLRTILRIHFIFSLCRVYAHIASGHRCDSSCTHDGYVGLERIYLLPLPSTGNSPLDKELLADSPIYAPVSLARASPQLASELRATAMEAWISRVPLPGQVFAARLPSCHIGNDSLHSTDSYTATSVGPIHLKDDTF